MSTTELKDTGGKKMPMFSGVYNFNAGAHLCTGAGLSECTPIWTILRTFDFFKDHTTEEIADALGKIKCEVDRSSIYRWFEKFIPFAHEYLRYMPIRTGEYVAADESVLLFEVP